MCTYLRNKERYRNKKLCSLQIFCTFWTNFWRYHITNLRAVSYVVHYNPPQPPLWPAGFRSRSRGIWLEPEPSFWPGSGSSFNFNLKINANCVNCTVHSSFDIFSWVKNKIGTLYTRSCDTRYFRRWQFLCSQEPEPAPGKKFPEPEPPQNRQPRVWQQQSCIK